MGKNVLARQGGDDYQAKFFWLKACGLNFPHTCVKKIAWEMDGTFGFDDVVVYYEPAVKDSGKDVTEKCYQVKFHVDHNKGFTWEALMEPEFIGNKTESILQRLYKNYENDSVNFPNKRFIIVNTWGVDYSNELRNLLGNNGGIRLDALFKGTPKSIRGKIREAWKKHLDIKDDGILKEVLFSLRIKHSYDDENKLKENLNFRLLHSGLQPVPENQHSSKYKDLIQQLHASGRNIFTKEELLDICKKENLYIGVKAEEKDFFKAGVRSFQRGAEDLHNEVHHISCLLHCFSGRFILEEYLEMDYINHEINELADKIIAAKSPVLLHLDTHLSIAMLLGKRLNPKYGGLDITIVQKTYKGNSFWKPELENSESYEGPFWEICENVIDDNGSDIVLSVNVTHDIREDVNSFSKDHLDKVKLQIHATIQPKVGGNSIKDATHAVCALEELVSSIRSIKRNFVNEGKLHVFIAAPNAMAFFLGQRISPLGSITLYEYDFEQQRDGGYHAILNL